MASNPDWDRSWKQGPWIGRASPLQIQAAGTLVASGALVFLGADIIGPRSGMTLTALVAGVAIYALISFLALRFLPLYPHETFGPANATTSLRAAFTAGIGGMVIACLVSGIAPSIPALWMIVAVAALCLSLDGVDGLLARRSGTASQYGARFDMEVDALLILLLSMVAALSAKAGPWVLLIGLMRYGFVFAQSLFPRMRGALPESWRRKAVCVVQGASIAIAIMPVVPQAVSAPLLGFALLWLLYSFAVDTFYLLTHRDDSRAP